MQICISLETDNHTSTPPLRFLQTVCPSCRPTNSIKALKAQLTTTGNKINTKTMQTSSSLSMIQAAWYSDVPFGTRFTILRLPFNSTATQTSHITQIRCVPCCISFCSSAGLATNDQYHLPTGPTVLDSVDDKNVFL